MGGPWPSRFGVPSSGERTVATALLLAGAAVCLCGGLAWLVGGLALHVGPLSVSLQRPLRSVGLGLAILLLREAWRPRARGCGARAAALAGLVAAALAADSRPRLVGDAHEYVAMAVNLARGGRPALTVAECERAEAEWDLAPGQLDGRAHGLVGGDGRVDFLHFWGYPLLVAPFVAVVTAAGGAPLGGFTVANVLFVAAASLALGRRAGGGAVAVLFAGPLLWWVDKPHPDLFIVSTLVAALALARSHTAAALALASLPAVQNPAFLPVLAVGTAWAWTLRPRPARLGRGTALAWALALVSPAYYRLHLGRAFPLGGTAYPHVPGAAELWAVLGDANLGLVPAWPSVGVLAVASLVLARSRLLAPGRGRDGLAAAAGAAVLVLAATQTANMNHGGTRGMSRYGLWLVPFVVPALVRLGSGADARSRAALGALGALSVLSLFPEYLPARAERYLSPTPLSRWAWTRHPRLARPLPEVFAERTWGREAAYHPPGEAPPGVVPAATARCEKALVRGDGTAIGRWPLQCVPARKPEPCRGSEALCYADGGRGGYVFARAPSQPAFRGEELRRWYWGGAPDEPLVAGMRQVPWAEMGKVAADDEAVFLAARHGTGRIQLLTTTGAFAAWFDGRRKEDAWVEPRVLRASTLLLVDPLSGRALARERLEPGETVRVPVPPVAPLLMVVTEGAPPPAP